MYANSLILTFRAWRNCHRISHELSTMSDHHRTDIGILRNDIDSVVSGCLRRRSDFPARP